MQVAERGWIHRNRRHMLMRERECVLDILVGLSLGLYYILSLTFLNRNHGTLSLHLFKVLNFNLVLIRREL